MEIVRTYRAFYSEVSDYYYGHCLFTNMQGNLIPVTEIVVYGDPTSGFEDLVEVGQVCEFVTWKEYNKPFYL